MCTGQCAPYPVQKLGILEQASRMLLDTAFQSGIVLEMVDLNKVVLLQIHNF